MRIAIEACASVDHRGWLALRRALWPEGGDDLHRAEMAAFLADPARYAQFVAVDGQGEPAGFVEASIRHDYVNGTSGSPVAFLEGLYVAPSHRRRGIARALVERVARWGRARECSELASDTSIDNEASRAAHLALGFAETERVVCFAKALE